VDAGQQRRDGSEAKVWREEQEHCWRPGVTFLYMTVRALPRVKSKHQSGDLLLDHGVAMGPVVS
jgi:hypothetical protein